MKCFLFLQAIFLLCLNGASADNERIENALRGALKLRNGGNNGGRALQNKPMMGRKGRRGYGWGNGKGKGKGKGKGMGKSKGYYYDSYDYGYGGYYPSSKY